MSVIDGFWIGSTDDIYRGSDQTKTLSDHLTNMESSIKSLDATFTATVSNGSFSVSPTANFVDKGVYLISLQYATNSGLVDRSTYAFKYDTSKLIQSTTILANCHNGNDDLMATYRNGTLTFATSYTGNGTPTNLTIKVI